MQLTAGAGFPYIHPASKDGVGLPFFRTDADQTRGIAMQEIATTIKTIALFAALAAGGLFIALVAFGFETGILL